MTNLKDYKKAKATIIIDNIITNQNFLLIVLIGLSNLL